MFFHTLIWGFPVRIFTDSYSPDLWTKPRSVAAGSPAEQRPSPTVWSSKLGSEVAAHSLLEAANKLLSTHPSNHDEPRTNTAWKCGDCILPHKTGEDLNVDIKASCPLIIALWQDANYAATIMRVNFFSAWKQPHKVCFCLLTSFSLLWILNFFNIVVGHFLYVVIDFCTPALRL